VFSCYKSGYKSLTWGQSLIYFVISINKRIDFQSKYLLRTKGEESFSSKIAVTGKCSTTLSHVIAGWSSKQQSKSRSTENIYYYSQKILAFVLKKTTSAICLRKLRSRSKD
jgi:hypothetical protein